MITMNTVCNLLGLLMGLYVTMLMLVAPNAQPFAVTKKSALAVGGRWTAQELAKLARTDNLATAVKRLTSSARKSGGAALEDEGWVIFLNVLKQLSFLS